nr:MAG: ORF1 [TTV-like mini virus]
MARYYYRRNWRPRWRKRYRTFWRRRTRGPFRRRRRWKRPVRRKLKALKLIQWQPSHINKLAIKGLYCLFHVHKDTYNQNFAQWETYVPPEGLPNGGGFTIIRFNLQCLFEQHEFARNVWTKSNKNWPLFRYTGCKIRVYRPLYVDLAVKFQTCYPMSASKLLYTGCQPSIMMMSKGCKKIRCKANAPNAKPYKTFRFRPPQQMLNKWYFQHNEAQTGFIMIQAAAASFDKYYISNFSESSVLTFRSLNTKIFTNLNFSKPPTYGYIPKPGFALYYGQNAGNTKVKDLIWLGNTYEYAQGYTIISKTTESTQWKQKVSKYMESYKNWGNPFHENYLTHPDHLLFGKSHPTIQLTGKIHNTETEISENTTATDAGLRVVTQELYFNIRYNPFGDKGYNNNIYIKANWKDNEDLEPDPDIDLQNPGFPNWLSCFGFKDYLIKLGTKSQIETHYIMVWKSEYFTPKLTYYIFIDKYFTQGDTDYLEGRTDWENTHWYPMITHQLDTLNKLALSGPGAPKLGDVKQAEAKIDYSFYFKIGGCAPPVEKVADPTKQPTYATPTNILETNSLQSPEEPIETFLYQFDWRRDQITKAAAERITKDYGTKTDLFTDAETTGTEVPLHQTLQKVLNTAEEKETEKETLFEQLQQHRQQQLQLRNRIKLLLAQLQSIE